MILWREFTASDHDSERTVPRAKPDQGRTGESARRRYSIDCFAEDRDADGEESNIG